MAIALASHSILGRTFPFDAVPARNGGSLLQQKSRALVEDLDKRVTREERLIYNHENIAKSISENNWFTASLIQSMICLAEPDAALEGPRYTAVRIPSLPGVLQDEAITRFADLSGDWENRLLRAGAVLAMKEGHSRRRDRIILNFSLVAFGVEWILENRNDNKLAEHKNALEWLQAKNVDVNFVFCCPEAVLIPLRMYLLSPLLLAGEVNWTNRSFRFSTALLLRWSAGTKPRELVELEKPFHRLIVSNYGSPGCISTAFDEAARLCGYMDEAARRKIAAFFADPRDPCLSAWPERHVSIQPTILSSAGYEQALAGGMPDQLDAPPRLSASAPCFTAKMSESYAFGPGSEEVLEPQRPLGVDFDLGWADFGVIFEQRDWNPDWRWEGARLTALEQEFEMCDMEEELGEIFEQRDWDPDWLWEGARLTALEQESKTYDMEEELEALCKCEDLDLLRNAMEETLEELLRNAMEETLKELESKYFDYGWE